MKTDVQNPLNKYLNLKAIPIKLHYWQSIS